MLNIDKLSEALAGLGRLLDTRGLSYELVVAGGSALLLLGLIERPTRDLDAVALVQAGHLVRADPLPDGLREAVRDIGAALGIDDDWLNPGPAALLDLGLPDGFIERAETKRYGSLSLHVASRQDQIFFKLYAATDQGPDSKHFKDLTALAPTADELIQGAGWARTHDPSEGFRAELIGLLRTLGLNDAAQVI
jgi:hypothetical protein